MVDKVFIPKKFSEMVEETQEKHCERGGGAAGYWNLRRIRIFSAAQM